MKLIPGLLIHHTPDGAVAVPTGDAALVLHGMMKLSSTAAFLLERMENDTTEDALVQALLENYTVEEARARADVSALLAQLKAVGCLIS